MNQSKKEIQYITFLAVLEVLSVVGMFKWLGPLTGFMVLLAYRGFAVFREVKLVEDTHSLIATVRVLSDALQAVHDAIRDAARQNPIDVEKD